MMEHLKLEGTLHSSSYMLKIFVKMGASWSAQIWSQISRYEKKHDFSTAEAAIILCHVTHESNYDDCMTSKYGKRKHKETSDLIALAVLW